MVDIYTIDFSTALWAVGIATWAVAAVYAFALALRVADERLMRCPETGAITLVGVEFHSRRAGDAPGASVVRCGLWPGKKTCGRGCLARCAETWPGNGAGIDTPTPLQRH